MNYYDTLQVLKSCSNEELQPLVVLIEKDWTNKLVKNKSYINIKNNPRLFVEEIYSEIRKFGGNTFANIYRGEGVPYKNVVNDVAKTLKVKQASSDLVELERQVLAKVLESTFERLSEKERKEMFSELGYKNFDEATLSGLSTFKGTAIVALLSKSPILMQEIIKILIRFGVNNAAQSVTSFVGTRAFSLITGPVGWIIGGLWTAYDISGPAKRVTLPSVVHIAAIRLTKMNENNNKKYSKYK